MIHNRSLPLLHDPIDGGLLVIQTISGLELGTLIHQLRFPNLDLMKKQWLLEAEYNYSPQLAMSTGGAELENHERSALGAKTGEMGKI